MREAVMSSAMRRRETKAKGTVPEEGAPIEARDVDISKEDEMLPARAKQVTPPSREGDVPDTAGSHGRMAPEAAKGLDEEADESLTR